MQCNGCTRERDDTYLSVIDSMNGMPISLVPILVPGPDCYIHDFSSRISQHHGAVEYLKSVSIVLCLFCCTLILTSGQLAFVVDI